MRVLFVTEMFPLCSGDVFEVTGGVENAALRTAQWLAQNQDVRVVTNYRRAPTAIRVGRLEIVQCGRRGRYEQAGQLLARASFQRHAVTAGVAFHPDVVVGWNFIAYRPAWRIARRCGVPAVAWYADVWKGRWLRLFGLPGLLGELLERRVLSCDWDKFIAISDRTQFLLEAQGIEPKRIAVIPPISDVRMPAGARSSLEEGKGNEELVAVVIARLVAYKRVDVVIRAFAQLFRRWPSLRLIVIGTGPKLNWLKELAAREGSANRIQWRGWVREHEEVLRTLASATVSVTASEVEGFGISTIESAALGVPYVAADIPAVQFATRGGQGGFLFPPGDVGRCAEAVEALLRNRELRMRKAAEGRELARLYRAEAIGPQFESLLQDLVEKRRSRDRPEMFR